MLPSFLQTSESVKNKLTKFGKFVDAAKFLFVLVSVIVVDFLQERTRELFCCSEMPMWNQILVQISVNPAVCSEEK
jgi:hypothetical protein